MELKGSREIAADRQTVWRALNDPEVLKASIPGCQEMTGSPEEGFAATVRQKVGPVNATFKGAVSLTDVVPGESYTITGEGKGGAAGYAKGGAGVRLEDAEGGGTILSYDVKASVGGKLAQLGSRIIDGFSKKMADQFFDNFKAAVEGPTAGEAAAEATPEPETAGAGGKPAAGAPAAVGPAPTVQPPDGGSARVAPEPAMAAGPASRGGAMPAAGAAAAARAPGFLARVSGWFRSLFGRG